MLEGAGIMHIDKNYQYLYNMCTYHYKYYIMSIFKNSIMYVLSRIIIYIFTVYIHLPKKGPSPPFCCRMLNPQTEPPRTTPLVSSVGGGTRGRTTGKRPIHPT